ALAALGDRDRDGSTGQEAGFLAADGDQIGLGEDSQQTVLAQGIDEILKSGFPDYALTKERDGGAGGGAGDALEAAAEILGSKGIDATDIAAGKALAVGETEVDAKGR